VSNYKQKPTPLPQTDLARGLLRLMGISLLFEFSALLLGIAILLIAHAVVFGILWLVLYWAFAQYIFVKITGLNKPSTQLPINLWQIINMVLKTAIVMAFLGLGFWVLFHKGFTGQNLIWMISHH